LAAFFMLFVGYAILLPVVNRDKLIWKLYLFSYQEMQYLHLLVRIILFFSLTIFTHTHENIYFYDGFLATWNNHFELLTSYVVSQIHCLQNVVDYLSVRGRRKVHGWGLHVQQVYEYARMSWLWFV
jgi:hypothetical protein